MAARDTAAGEWYFETSLGRDLVQGRNNGQACQIGFWLPRDDIGPFKSDRSDPEAAQKPSERQCQRILNATIAAAARKPQEWVGASINLRKIPTNQGGEWKGGAYYYYKEEHLKEEDVISTGIAIPPSYIPKYAFSTLPHTDFFPQQVKQSTQATQAISSASSRVFSPQDNASTPTAGRATVWLMAKRVRRGAEVGTGHPAIAVKMGKRAASRVIADMTMAIGVNAGTMG
ncbi:MAG: hypothetical protein Q9182_001892 [Xanthomendoza sp. 2 TL-2023]